MFSQKFVDPCPDELGSLIFGEPFFQLEIKISTICARFSGMAMVIFKLVTCSFS